MSTNEHDPLRDDALGTHPVPARRSALLGPQDTGWTDLAEFAGPAEPQTPTIRPSVYLHGLRRHWMLSTFLGVLFAGMATVAVWLLWGPSYTASAYFQVKMSDDPLVFPKTGKEYNPFNQGAYEIYKDTLAQRVTGANVLTNAFDKRVIVGGQETKAGQLPSVQWADKWGDPIVWLQKELSVAFPGDAEIMEISLTLDNPDEATALVNAVVDAYQKEVLDAEVAERNDRLSKLDDIYIKNSGAVRAKENERDVLMKQVKANDPETLMLRQQVALRQFGDLQNQHSQAKMAMENAQRDLTVQEDLLAQLAITPIPGLDVEEYIFTNPKMRQLAAELTTQLMAQNQARSFARPDSSSAYADKYTAELSMIESEIRKLEVDAEQKIREKKQIEIQAEIGKLKIQVAALSDQVQRLAADVQKREDDMDVLTAKSIDLEISQREIERLNVVVDTVHAEREKLRVESQSERRVRNLQRAQAPTTQSKLGIRIALTVLAAIAGLCAPVACITWWDTRAERINTPADVSRGLGLTVLGSIPTVPARIIRQLGSPSKRHRAWHLRLTESIDGIAARLLRQADAAQTRVILISSAASGEGKTTLATQLAMSLARNGRRTALVDFDLRRPAFDKVLGLPLEPGVSEVLRGQSETGEVVHQTGTNNLHVVTAGRWDRSALTALANGAAGRLFDALRTEYEFVVVDAAPILPVADTRFVSQHVDAVILSVFRDVSRAPKISAACEILEAFGVGNVEAVVTGAADNLRDRDVRYEASGLPA